MNLSEIKVSPIGKLFIICEPIKGEKEVFYIDGVTDWRHLGGELRFKLATPC